MQSTPRGLVRRDARTVLNKPTPGRSGGVWSQRAYLKASNVMSNDQYGASIALSADGNTLAVGAPYERSGATGINGDQADNGTVRVGAVFVY